MTVEHLWRQKPSQYSRPVESLERRLLLSAGQLDTNFGNAGIRLFNTGLGYKMRDAAIDQAGRIVVLFADTATGDSAIRRFLADGSNDPTFNLVSGPDLGQQEQLDAIAVQSDGKVIAAGSAATGDVVVTRYSLNGTVDGTFGISGSAVISTGNQYAVNDIAVRPDNRILIAGSVTIAAATDFVVLGLDANGQPDAAFGGLSTDFGGDVDAINSIALMADGRIAVAGTSFNPVSLVSTLSLAVYSATGTPDAQFNGGTVQSGLVSATASSHMVISGGNRITLLDTQFGPANDQLAVARFNDQGQADQQFSGDGIATSFNTDVIGSAFDGGIAVDNVGQIVVAYDVVGGGFDTGRLLRLNPDGTLDGSFNDPGALGSQGFVEDSSRLLVGPQNTLVVATAITNNDLVLARFEGSHPPQPLVVSFTGNTTTNTLSVRVQYQGEVPIDPATVGIANVRLLGASGYDQPAGAAGAITVNGNNLAVTYTFTPPGGTFDIGDAGAYQLAFQTNAVLDTNGNAVPPKPFDLTLNAGGGLPDLAFANTGFSPGLYFPGDSIVANLTATATGGAVSSFDLQVFLSRDKIAGNADDILVHSSIVTTQSTTVTSLGPLETNVVPGDYFLIARLDPDGEVAEFDEANNLLVSKDPSIAVRPPKPVVPPKGIGQPDSDFGSGGRIRPVLGFVGTGGVLEQSDGSILIAGSLTGAGDTDVGIARRLSNGDKDTNYGSGTGLVGIDLRNTDDRVVDIALLAGDKVLVAGSSKEVDSEGSDFFVTRRNNDGSNDSTFGIDGKIFINFDPNPQQGPDSRDDARDMLVDSQGRILIVGRTDAGGSVNFAIARLTADGLLDPSFGVNGRVVTDFAGGADAAEAVALTANGSIVVTGFATEGAARHLGVAQYTPDGVLDAKFGVGGLATATAGNPDEHGSAIAISSTGQIVVAGFTSGGVPGSGGFFSHFLVARFTSKGKLDKRFGNQGVATKDVGAPARATYLELLADGRVITSGVASSSVAQGLAGTFDIAIARFTAAGQPDTSFDDDGSVIIQTGDTASSVQSNASSLLATDGGNAPLATADENLSDFQNSADGKLYGRSGGGAYAAGTNGDETVVVALVTSGIELSGTVISAAPSAIIGGKKGSISVNVTNLGDVTAEGAIDVTFYASADQELGSGDSEFFSISGRTVKLKPLSLNGKAKKLTAKFTYPSDLPDGAYYLLAEIEPGTITELNINNNTAFTSSPIQITAPVVDLTGPVVAGGIAFVTGKTATVPVTLTNEGNVTLAGTASLVFVFSIDDVVDVDDATLSPVSIKLSLKPNSSKLLKVKLAPPAIDAGDYFLFVILDSTNVVAEMNEANNLLSSTLSSSLQ